MDLTWTRRDIQKDFLKRSPQEIANLQILLNAQPSAFLDFFVNFLHKKVLAKQTILATFGFFVFDETFSKSFYHWSTSPNKLQEILETMQFYIMYLHPQIILGGDLSAGSPTDTLLWLNPPHRHSVREHQFPNAASLNTHLDDLTGGVCKKHGPIHRAISLSIALVLPSSYHSNAQ